MDNSWDRDCVVLCSLLAHAPTEWRRRAPASFLGPIDNASLSLGLLLFGGAQAEALQNESSFFAIVVFR
jgi:hypothetical protein